MIEWMYAFADRPASYFEAASDFWAAATGTTLSARRGGNGEFATFLPPHGDAYLKVQATGGTGGVHLDLSVAEPGALVAAATALGAEVVAPHQDFTVLCSPGGLLFCAVPPRGEAVRPGVVTHANASRSRVDQVSIDVAPAAHDAELAFWSALTGWETIASRIPEFHVIKQPLGLPLRLLVQRLGTAHAGRAVTAHLDVACADVAGVREFHERLGAAVIAERPLWTVMRDPAGGVYCLTSRDPETGTLPG